MPESTPDHGPQLFAVAIIEMLRQPMLVLGAGQHVKFAGPSFYETFQTSPGQTLDRSVFDLGNGEWNSPVLRKMLDELLPTHGGFANFPVEHDFPGIGRRTMFLNAHRLMDGDKNANMILVSMEDVTERLNAQRSLESSEVRYRRLFEAAHDGILILSAGTRKITDVNPFMLQLLDYPREHFIDKELWEIGIFRDKEAHQRAMKELQENGTIRFENLPLQDRNGHGHPVEIVANIYQESSERVIQCNIRDIGDRYQFEREREALLVNEQASRLEAEAANRSKDLFLATLSHEVRTPLNAILGWATLLRRSPYNAADFEEGLEVIERNCKAQAQLIEDVLDVSRIVSGKLRLHIRPCELIEIIHAAIDAVRPTADAKGIELQLTLDPAASPISCDKDRMQQVVWNLVSNAIKFTPKGRAVRISLARDRSVTELQVSVEIRVSDDGQGISPDFLPYVFDRFRQADSSTRRKMGGLGLGLSIVKHIVEVHGGTVKAESAGEGLGATFTVTLPIRAALTDDDDDQSPSVSRVAATLLPVRLDGLRVMMVDDEVDARRVLARLLAEAGAVVTSVASVAEAMAALPVANPQVLVSDIAMPDQDGYDLIRQIRASGRSAKDLPAIALTAFAHKNDGRRLLLAGFQVHVPKPVDPHDLIAFIASLAGLTG